MKQRWMKLVAWMLVACTLCAFVPTGIAEGGIPLISSEDENKGEQTQWMPLGSGSGNNDNIPLLNINDQKSVDTPISGIPLLNMDSQPLGNTVQNNPQENQNVGGGIPLLTDLQDAPGGTANQGLGTAFTPMMMTMGTNTNGNTLLGSGNEQGSNSVTVTANKYTVDWMDDVCFTVTAPGASTVTLKDQNSGFSATGYFNGNDSTTIILSDLTISWRATGNVVYEYDNIYVLDAFKNSQLIKEYMSEEAAEIMYYVCCELDETLKYIWNGINGTTNSYMYDDMLAGFTNNMGNLHGHGPAVSEDQKEYWYDITGPTYYQNAEAWAEYYSSMMTGKHKDDNLNDFKEACGIMDEMAKDLLEQYKAKHAN